MKALTVRQPWAYLISQGSKTIEVRTWLVPAPVRLAIHAGQRPDLEACTRLSIRPESLVRGSLLGSVDVTEVFPFTLESWERLRSETMEVADFRLGLLGWRLRNPITLERPIPCRGSLGLFEVPDEILLGAVRYGPQTLASSPDRNDAASSPNASQDEPDMA